MACTRVITSYSIHYTKLYDVVADQGQQIVEMGIIAVVAPQVDSDGSFPVAFLHGQADQSITLKIWLHARGEGQHRVAVVDQIYGGVQRVAGVVDLLA